MTVDATKIFRVYLPAKQVWEKLPYQVRCKPFVARGEVISTFAVAIYDQTADPAYAIPEMLIDTAFQAKAVVVQFRAYGGTTGHTYIARLRLVMESGSQYELEAQFDVVEEQ